MGIVTEMRGFEIDHEPDGWPAVRMRQISALCDEVDRLRKDAERARWLQNALEHIAGSCEGRAAEIATEALKTPNVQGNRPPRDAT